MKKENTRKNIPKKVQICIIDPASPEPNRGSFCYLPYILYCGLKSQGRDVYFFENFTLESLDSVPEADMYLVALWSYPQIEWCRLLEKFLPKPPQFFGYYPLIEEFHFSCYEVSRNLILQGMQYYPECYSDFEFLLLSDCDMHLSKYEGVVHPLFLSYGCNKICSFCPVPANLKSGKRIVLSRDTAASMLLRCKDLGILNIHFTDEDFFYDVDFAYDVLKQVVGYGMRFIVLGSIFSVAKFVRKYGETILEQAGVKLIEVGFESADDFLSKTMLKKNSDKDLSVLLQMSVDIFWLCLTFFPGETIGTLNRTGLFLKKWGFKKEELYGRIVTNSTIGGLGQFFQPYHGTVGYNLCLKEGLVLSTRPMRLVPSYIPNSFLDSVVTRVDFKNLDYFWFDLYRVHFKDLRILPNTTVREICELNKGVTSFLNICIYLALCSRLGVVVGE